MKIKRCLPALASLSYLLMSSCLGLSDATTASVEAETPEPQDTLVNRREEELIVTTPPTIDSAVYFDQLHWLANGDTSGRWPVTKQPLPLSGALLPNHRIIAYYGNLYSKNMGILGELPPAEMLSRLEKEVALWKAADSVIRPVPALHYIAVTAQGSPGRDGKYRMRMPDKHIDSILDMAGKLENGQVFLDIQVGLSTLQEELPRLEKYLKMPQVHLGIDPEFSMKDGSKPGSRIGSFNAADINYANGYLKELVEANQLPPKIMVVHRFTQAMVKDYKDIDLSPEVQMVIVMDGWGAPELKKGTYRHFIYPEPVQFTGFKLFYKNDVKKPPHRMLNPEELVKLKPMPSYIQYQ